MNPLSEYKGKIVKYQKGLGQGTDRDWFCLGFQLSKFGERDFLIREPRAMLDHLL